jgi:hypothetical protein
MALHRLWIMSLKSATFCTPRTPFRDTLDTQPAFSLYLENQISSISGVGNIIASLEHRDRIYKINLHDLSSSQLEAILAAMQEPFPDPMDLQLGAHDRAHDASRFRFVLG